MVIIMIMTDLNLFPQASRNSSAQIVDIHFAAQKTHPIPLEGAQKGL